MKIILFFLSVLFALNTFGQSSPELKLVGSNFSYAKGNIDVELLTEIIQQKQEEVAQRAFRNLVIGEFNKSLGSRKSFTTYFYIYNILQTFTTEKNKTVITRQVVNNMLEYAIINGFTLSFLKSKEISSQKSYNQKSDINNILVDISKTDFKDNNNIALKNIDSDESWKSYNFYLDMAYDIFLSDQNKLLQKKGLFKLVDDSPNLLRWYKEDNAYLINKNVNLPLINSQRKLMEEAYQNFLKNELGENLKDIFDDLIVTDFKQESLTQKQYDATKKILREVIRFLKNYSNGNTIGTISEYLLDYTLIEFREDNDKKGILYIDAEGVISSLHEKFASPYKRSPISKRMWFITPKPFITIGANYGGSFSTGNSLINKDGAISDLNNIYFANEKVGIKFIFEDKKYTRSFQPGEEYKYKGIKYAWTRPQTVPFVSRQELLFYGSGLLYNTIDIKSNQNFNYTLVGTAYGITFFNDLILNFGISLPVNANNGIEKNKLWLYNLSFDIPIIEYVTAVRKKRK